MFTKPSGSLLVVVFLLCLCVACLRLDCRFLLEAALGGLWEGSGKTKQMTKAQDGARILLNGWLSDRFSAPPH